MDTTAIHGGLPVDVATIPVREEHEPRKGDGFRQSVLECGYRDDTFFTIGRLEAAPSWAVDATVGQMAEIVRDADDYSLIEYIIIPDCVVAELLS